MPVISTRSPSKAPQPLVVVTAIDGQVVAVNRGIMGKSMWMPEEDLGSFAIGIHDPAIRPGRETGEWLDQVPED